MRKIRYLDMFAGIGGFRSGLTNAGDFFMPVGWCEIDKYAQKAYRAIYETEGEYFCEDAKRIDPDDLPSIDLICAGFPCQSFSVAGKRLGFRDTRGTLFFEVAGILRKKRPPFLLLENVPGLLSHDQGRTLETIFSVLVEMGYSIEWCVLDSQYFYVPQQRKRLFIVGFLDGRCAGKVFPVRNGSAKNLQKLIEGSQGCRVYDPSGVVCTQCASTNKGVRNVCFSESGGVAERVNPDVYVEASDTELATTQGGKTGLYFIDMNPAPGFTEVARCITARQDSGISNRKGEHSGVFVEEAPRAILTPEKGTTRQNGRRFKEPDEPMFTITAQDRHGVIHRGRIRKLMPVECWRLQGFTDEQFGKVAALGLADSHLYKMAGNSVTVTVITAIGLRIAELCEEFNILKEE